MSDPKEQQREGDELDLDAEKVTDLEVEEQGGQKVRGGLMCASVNWPCGSATKT